MEVLPSPSAVQPCISVLLVWQIVPWLLSGFESVGKYVEEASSDFGGKVFYRYCAHHLHGTCILLASDFGGRLRGSPWQSLQSNQQFPTAVAFERALHAHWIVLVIMASALVGVVQAFNANMIASSRLLFAMGRRNLLAPKMAYVHPVNQTPSTAVIAVGAATAVAMLLGEAGLVPILEVGAVASAIGWMSGCVSYYCMKPGSLGRAAAIFGILVTSLMVFVKIVPVVPGHFTRYEWMALAIWAVIGFVIRIPTRQHRDLIEGKTEVLRP